MEKIKEFIKKKSFVKDVLIALFLTYIITSFVFYPVIVNGSSMYPTLQGGQIGLMGKWFDEEDIERFDIVVVKTEDLPLIKRVIGLPGEKVEYRDNKLYINDEYVEETFIDPDVKTSFYIEEADGYICLGDNREHSTDSRFYGAFSYKQIFAKGFFSLTKKFGIVK